MMKILNQEISLKEMTEILVKGVAASFPVAGSVASIYNDWQNKIQISNILDVLKNFEERLAILEDSINNDFMSSNKFISLLINVSLKGQNEMDSDRRLLYSNFLVACCLKDNKDNDYFSLLDIISRMNYLQIKILRYVDENIPSSFNIMSGNLYHITSQFDKIDNWKIEKELDYLISLGLVVRVDVKGTGKLLSSIGFKHDVNNFIGHEDIYYRTVLGNTLIFFIMRTISI